jgi:hypothetical protein
VPLVIQLSNHKQLADITHLNTSGTFSFYNITVRHYIAPGENPDETILKRYSKKTWMEN